MSDHPTTFRAEPAELPEVAWQDMASIRRRDEGGGVLHAMKTIHRGTLAEMVAMISNMPAERRQDFVIEKAGDRQLDLGEIMALAERDDFPG